MSLLEDAESKSETCEESAKQDNPGVKSYNEKFTNLIYTRTGVIQQII